MQTADYRSYMTSVLKTGATVAVWMTRFGQLLLGLLALYLILAPLVGSANFFEGLALTILGLVALVGIIVIEVFLWAGRRFRSDDD